MREKRLLIHYIFTSHERSCEQNGHGNVSDSASMRFCFGGGLRLDLLLPIVRVSDENLKRVVSNERVSFHGAVRSD